MHRAALVLVFSGLFGLILPAFGAEPSGLDEDATLLRGGLGALPYVSLAAVLVGLGLSVAGYRKDPTTLGDPRAWRRFRRNRGALAGAVLVVLVGGIALIGPLVAPHDPDHIYDLGLNEEGVPMPSGTVFTRDGARVVVGVFDDPGPGARGAERFLLGTDNLGRDMLSRIFYGGRVSLAVAMGAVAIAGTLGFFAGMLGGYLRGFVDGAIIQLINYVLSLPFLLVAIALNRVIDDPSLLTLCVLLGLLSWTTLARVTRAKTLAVRELEYVQAARALGMGHGRILFRHVMPNVLGPAIVLVTTLIAQMIIVESAMSFLGLGVKPPTASWGTMLRDGQDYMAYAPNLLVFPAILIVATVFGFNLLGEGMRDALDPKE